MCVCVCLFLRVCVCVLVCLFVCFCFVVLCCLVLLSCCMLVDLFCTCVVVVYVRLLSLGGSVCVIVSVCGSEIFQRRTRREIDKRGSSWTESDVVKRQRQ